MEPNFLILYVSDMAKSVAFYTDVIGHPPVNAADTFTTFALSSGVMFALWQRDDVEPAATTPGGVEVCLPAESAAEVDAVAATWRERGVPIDQEPVQMGFGYTFVGQDPDGHRLRVFFTAPPAS